MVFLLLSADVFSQIGLYALKFDGTNEYVKTSYSSSVKTIEFWFKTGSFNTLQGLCGQQDDVVQGQGNWQMHWNDDAPYNKLRIYAYNPGEFEFVTNSTFETGKWYHVAVTCSGTEMQYYVNGVLDNTLGSTFICDNDFLVFGGSFGNSTLYPFDGTMDEVRVWEDVRTAAEIKANMYRELAGNEDNLMAYYKMSDGSGSSVTDNTGHAFSGTLYNSPVWSASGCFAGSRQALDFDGSNDYVAITNGVVLGNTFTQEMWIYPTNGSEVYRGILGKQSPNGSVHRPPCIFQFGRKIHYGFGNGTWYSELTQEILTINAWNHLAVTFDGTTYRVYVNGILKNSSLVASGQTPEAWGQDELGKVDIGYFQGKIDEVRIWSDARTESEIRENMMQSIVGNEANLVGYYRFDQYDGAVLYDLTSGVRNGALTNMEPADWVPSTAFSTWIGGESTTWATPGNWSNDIPTLSQSAGIYNWGSALPLVSTYLPILPTTMDVNNLLVPSGVTASGNVNLTADGSVFLGSSLTLSALALNTAGNLTIESGKTLTLPATAQFTVSGALTNNAGNSGLVIQSNATGTGSLIQGSSSVGATVERYITGSEILTANKYHFVSIPVNYESPTSNLFLGSYLYELDAAQTDPGNSNYYGLWVNLGSSTTTLLSCQSGYMIYYPAAATTYSFTGNLNTGAFTPPVSYGGTYTFNLVPNPYPSAIDWGAASGWTKTHVGGSCYIWNAVTGNYSTLSGTSYIPAGQAFIVMTDASSPVLAMNNGVCVHNGQDFYKSSETAANHLRISASSNNYYDETVVAFDANGSEGFDLELDGFKLRGLDDAPQLWTRSGTFRLSINTLPPHDREVTVAMDFETEYTGPVTLTASGIETFGPLTTLYLEDKTLATMVNLRLDPVYIFDYTSGSAVDRFILHFNSAIGIGEPTTKERGKAFVSNGSLYVEVPGMQGCNVEISLYNTLGQRISAGPAYMDGLVRMDVPPSTGILIVHVVTPNRHFVTKVLNN